MDGALKELDLSRGLRWVRDSLSRGGGASAAVLERNLLERGAVWAILPDNYDLEAERSIDHGGVTSSEVADAGLANALVRLGVDTRTVLLEDELALPGDKDLLATRGEGLWIYQGQILRTLDIESTTTSVVGFLRSGSSGYPTNAFMLNTRLDPRPQMPATLGPHELCQALNGLLAVTVAAFDAETWLIWQRS